MPVFPPPVKANLNVLMELSDGGLTGNKQASPDHGADPGQYQAQLVNHSRQSKFRPLPEVTASVCFLNAPGIECSRSRKGSSRSASFADPRQQCRKSGGPPWLRKQTTPDRRGTTDCRPSPRFAPEPFLQVAGLIDTSRVRIPLSAMNKSISYEQHRGQPIRGVDMPWVSAAMASALRPHRDPSERLGLACVLPDGARRI